uniref:Uncharacterized protein n=1 Tax=Meloidogyne floridensis TaxID=298350 RepID=A0A915P375_9BILA
MQLKILLLLVLTNIIINFCLGNSNSKIILNISNEWKTDINLKYLNGIDDSERFKCSLLKNGEEINGIKIGDPSILFSLKDDLEKLIKEIQNKQIEYKIKVKGEFENDEDTIIKGFIDYLPLSSNNSLNFKINIVDKLFGVNTNRVYFEFEKNWKLENIYENKANDCLKRIKESQNRAIENFKKLERLNNEEILQNPQISSTSNLPIANLNNASSSSTNQSTLIDKVGNDTISVEESQQNTKNNQESSKNNNDQNIKEQNIDNLMDRIDDSEQNEVNQQNTSQQIHSSNNEQILENEKQQKYYQTNRGQEQQNSTDGQLIETISGHLNNQEEGINKQNEQQINKDQEIIVKQKESNPNNNSESKNLEQPKEITLNQMEGEEVEQDVIQREIYQQGNLTEKQLPDEQILDKLVEKSHNQLHLKQNEIPSVDRIEEEQPTEEDSEKQELNYQKEGNIQKDYNIPKELVNEENNNKINKQKEHSIDEKQNEITQNQESQEVDYEASLKENNKQENLIGENNNEENITLNKKQKENSPQKDKIPSDYINKNLEKEEEQSNEREKLVDEVVQINKEQDKTQRKEKHLIVEERNTNEFGPKTIQHSIDNNQQKQAPLTEKEFLPAEKEKMKEKNKQKVVDDTFKELEKQKEKQPKLTEEQLKELHKLIEEHPHFHETNKENDTDNELEIIEKPIEIINISSDTEEEKRKNKKPPSKKHHKSDYRL